MWKAVRSAFERTSDTVWSKGRISPCLCEGHIQTASVWSKSLARYASRGEHLETPGRTSNCATSSGTSRDTFSAAGPGVHVRLQELDPPRGSQTLRRVLLGSRVQLRTCQSALQYRSAPTAVALIHAHSRRQAATSNRWLAPHRLERGGAA